MKQDYQTINMPSGAALYLEAKPPPVYKIHSAVTRKPNRSWAFLFFAVTMVLHRH
jgi:hypothetical protein